MNRRNSGYQKRPPIVEEDDSLTGRRKGRSRSRSKSPKSESFYTDDKVNKRGFNDSRLNSPRSRCPSSDSSDISGRRTATLRSSSPTEQITLSFGKYDIDGGAGRSLGPLVEINFREPDLCARRRSIARSLEVKEQNLDCCESRISTRSPGAQSLHLNNQNLVVHASDISIKRTPSSQSPNPNQQGVCASDISIGRVSKYEKNVNICGSDISVGRVQNGRSPAPTRYDVDLHISDKMPSTRTPNQKKHKYDFWESDISVGETPNSRTPNPDERYLNFSTSVTSAQKMPSAQSTEPNNSAFCQSDIGVRTPAVRSPNQTSAGRTPNLGGQHLNCSASFVNTQSRHSSPRSPDPNNVHRRESDISARKLPSSQTPNPDRHYLNCNTSVGSTPRKLTTRSPYQDNLNFCQSDINMKTRIVRTPNQNEHHLDFCESDTNAIKKTCGRTPKIDERHCSAFVVGTQKAISAPMPDTNNLDFSEFEVCTRTPSVRTPTRNEHNIDVCDSSISTRRTPSDWTPNPNGQYLYFSTSIGSAQKTRSSQSPELNCLDFRALNISTRTQSVKSPSRNKHGPDFCGSDNNPSRTPSGQAPNHEHFSCGTSVPNTRTLNVRSPHSNELDFYQSDIGARTPSMQSPNPNDLDLCQSDISARTPSMQSPNPNDLDLCQSDISARTPSMQSPNPNDLDLCESGISARRTPGGQTPYHDGQYLNCSTSVLGTRRTPSVQSPNPNDLDFCQSDISARTPSMQSPNPNDLDLCESGISARRTPGGQTPYHDGQYLNCSTSVLGTRRTPSVQSPNPNDLDFCQSDISARTPSMQSPNPNDLDLCESGISARRTPGGQTPYHDGQYLNCSTSVLGTRRTPSVQSPNPNDLDLCQPDISARTPSMQSPNPNDLDLCESGISARRTPGGQTPYHDGQYLNCSTSVLGTRRTPSVRSPNPNDLDFCQSDISARTPSMQSPNPNDLDLCESGISARRTPGGQTPDHAGQYLNCSTSVLGTRRTPSVQSPNPNDLDFCQSDINARTPSMQSPNPNDLDLCESGISARRTPGGQTPYHDGQYLNCSTSVLGTRRTPSVQSPNPNDLDFCQSDISARTPSMQSPNPNDLYLYESGISARRTPGGQTPDHAGQCLNCSTSVLGTRRTPSVQSPNPNDLDFCQSDINSRTPSMQSPNPNDLDLCESGISARRTPGGQTPDHAGQYLNCSTSVLGTRRTASVRSPNPNDLDLCESGISARRTPGGQTPDHAGQYLNCSTSVLGTRRMASVRSPNPNDLDLCQSDISARRTPYIQSPRQNEHLDFCESDISARRTPSSQTPNPDGQDFVCSTSVINVRKMPIMQSTVPNSLGPCKSDIRAGETPNVRLTQKEHDLALYESDINARGTPSTGSPYCSKQNTNIYRVPTCAMRIPSTRSPNHDRHNLDSNVSAISTQKTASVQLPNPNEHTLMSDISGGAIPFARLPSSNGYSVGFCDSNGARTPTAQSPHSNEHNLNTHRHGFNTRAESNAKASNSSEQTLDICDSDISARRMPTIEFISPNPDRANFTLKESTISPQRKCSLQSATPNGQGLQMCESGISVGKTPTVQSPVPENCKITISTLKTRRTPSPNLTKQNFERLESDISVRRSPSVQPPVRQNLDCCNITITTLNTPKAPSPYIDEQNLKLYKSDISIRKSPSVQLPNLDIQTVESSPTNTSPKQVPSAQSPLPFGKDAILCDSDISIKETPILQPATSHKNSSKSRDLDISLKQTPTMQPHYPNEHNLHLGHSNISRSPISPSLTPDEYGRDLCESDTNLRQTPSAQSAFSDVSDLELQALNSNSGKTPSVQSFSVEYNLNACDSAIQARKIASPQLALDEHGLAGHESDIHVSKNPNSQSPFSNGDRLQSQDLNTDLRKIPSVQSPYPNDLATSVGEISGRESPTFSGQRLDFSGSHISTRKADSLQSPNVTQQNLDMGAIGPRTTSSLQSPSQNIKILKVNISTTSTPKRPSVGVVSDACKSNISVKTSRVRSPKPELQKLNFCKNTNSTRTLPVVNSPHPNARDVAAINSANSPGIQLSTSVDDDLDLDDFTVKTKSTLYPGLSCSNEPKPDNYELNVSCRTPKITESATHERSTALDKHYPETFESDISLRINPSAQSPNPGNQNVDTCASGFGITPSVQSPNPNHQSKDFSTSTRSVSKILDARLSNSTGECLEAHKSDDGVRRTPSGHPPNSDIQKLIFCKNTLGTRTLPIVHEPHPNGADEQYLESNDFKNGTSSTMSDRQPVVGQHNPEISKSNVTTQKALSVQSPAPNEHESAVYRSDGKMQTMCSTSCNDSNFDLAKRSTSDRPLTPYENMPDSSRSEASVRSSPIEGSVTQSDARIGLEPESLKAYRVKNRRAQQTSNCRKHRSKRHKNARTPSPTSLQDAISGTKEAKKHRNSLHERKVEKLDSLSSNSQDLDDHATRSRNKLKSDLKKTSAGVNSSGYCKHLADRESSTKFRDGVTPDKQSLAKKPTKVISKGSLTPVLKDIKDKYSLYLSASGSVKDDMIQMEMEKLISATYGIDHNVKVRSGTKSRSSGQVITSTQSKDSSKRSGLLEHKQSLVQKRSSNYCKDVAGYADRLAELLKQREKGRAQIDEMIRRQIDKELLEAKIMSNCKRRAVDGVPSVGTSTSPSKKRVTSRPKASNGKLIKKDSSREAYVAINEVTSANSAQKITSKTAKCYQQNSASYARKKSSFDNLINSMLKSQVPRRDSSTDSVRSEVETRKARSCGNRKQILTPTIEPLPQAIRGRSYNRDDQDSRDTFCVSPTAISSEMSEFGLPRKTRVQPDLLYAKVNNNKTLVHSTADAEFRFPPISLAKCPSAAREVIVTNHARSHFVIDRALPDVPTRCSAADVQPAARREQNGALMDNGLDRIQEEKSSKDYQGSFVSAVMDAKSTKTREETDMLMLEKNVVSRERINGRLSDVNDSDKHTDSRRQQNTQRPSHSGHGQRLVKFSQSTVVGGQALQKEVVDLSDFNEYEDDDVVKVTTVRSSAASGMMSPKHSTTHTGRRRYSIDTQNDPIGYGMSSFLSTRDSLELQQKRDSEESLRSHLSKLITEINAGNLGQVEMRQLTNFAQKLLNANLAGEVIGKHNIDGHDDGIEVLVDSTLPNDTMIYRTDSDRTVSDNVNSLILDIRQHRLTSVQLADLALSVVEASSKSAIDINKKLSAIVPNDRNRELSEALLESLQSKLGNIQQGESNQGANTSRVKWHEEPESHHLIRLLHKLKAQMILAPNGGSFVESLEKVIKDVDEDVHCNYFYDSMILCLCMIVTYQEWQNEHGQDNTAWRHQTRYLTRFDGLANEILITMFQKTTAGMQRDEYSMEDLIRLTTLVSSCDVLAKKPANEMISRKCSIQPEPLCKDQEEIAVQSLTLMKKLLNTETATSCDLKSLASAAYRLQSKSLGQPLQTTQCIWAVRKSSTRLTSKLSERSLLLIEKSDPAEVEISFLTHLRVKLNNLKQAYGSIEILQATLQITESALDALADNSELTDFWAASLVLVVAIIFEQIKSECYTAALDYKVLNLLVNNLVYEAFNVALKALRNNHITLDTFQLLTAAITKYRVQDSAAPVFTISPRLLGGIKNQTAQSVSSPYAVMDFLEQSLQVMKNSPASKPIEVKALGDYALSLQHYYGQEEMSNKGMGYTMPAISEAPKMSPWRWSGIASANDGLPKMQVVTPKLVLEHLDAAIEKVRLQEVKARDLLSIACFVTYLVEVPEQLARDEQPSLPPQQCSNIREFEKRLKTIRKITHYIPRFDFIVTNLEKTLSDLKRDMSTLYNYDLILLCMCIFVAYEWIRTEPLSVFSVTKLDGRAANVIYEAMQSTLQGIKSGHLALDDLQNLTTIITNTTDLRRASAVNVSARRTSSSKQTETIEVISASSTQALEKDTMVLEFIEELIVNNEERISISKSKLDEIVDSIRADKVSRYLHQLFVLSIFLVTTIKTVVISNYRAASPVPNLEIHAFATKMIRRAVDGLRQGYLQGDQVSSLVDLVVNQTNGKIVKSRRLKEAVMCLNNPGTKLADFLIILGFSASTPPTDNVVERIHDFLGTLDETGTGRSNVTEPPARAEPVVLNIYPDTTLSIPLDPGDNSSISNRTHLLRELSKDAINRLITYMNSGYFSDSQLQSLSETLYQITSYYDQNEADKDEKTKMEQVLGHVLSTIRVIVNNPMQAERVLRSHTLCSASILNDNDEHLARYTNLASSAPKSRMSSPGKAMSNKQELQNALALVINGLENGQYTKEDMDMLSHSLGQAFLSNEAVTEPVREIELHGMMGKRPLHVSSEFLGETLSAISIKPDGLRRYSYKSLINPDLTKVEGIGGAPERTIGRRLSMLSEANVASAAMVPLEEEERTRRRSSIPTRDFVLRPIQDLPDEDEVEEDMWEASMHEIKVSNSVHNYEDLAETNKSPERPNARSASPNANNKSKTTDKGKANKNNSSCIDVQTTERSLLSDEDVLEQQKNNNASVLVSDSFQSVQTSKEITKSPPISESEEAKEKHKQRACHVGQAEACNADQVRTTSQMSASNIMEANIKEDVAKTDQPHNYASSVEMSTTSSGICQAASGVESDSSLCPALSGDGDSYTPPMESQHLSDKTNYPKPTRAGGARTVRKTSLKSVQRDPLPVAGARLHSDVTRRSQTLPELAKAKSKQTVMQDVRPKTKPRTATLKKKSSFKSLEPIFSAYGVGKSPKK